MTTVHIAVNRGVDVTNTPEERIPGCVTVCLHFTSQPVLEVALLLNNRADIEAGDRTAKSGRNKVLVGSEEQTNASITPVDEAAIPAEDGVVEL